MSGLITAWRICKNSHGIASLNNESRGSMAVSLTPGPSPRGRGEKNRESLGATFTVKYADTAFDGEGARLAGGRWNPRGFPVIYLASSLSLAVLELFVHLKRNDHHIDFVSFKVDIPTIVSRKIIKLDKLPRGWNAQPPQSDSMKIGKQWLTEARHATLFVPSVLVPHEHDILLNPKHADFRKIIIHRPQAYIFDPRLWK